MANREQVVKVAEKYVAKGKLDAAIKEYLKVLKENPNDVSTLNRLGDLYARTSRIDEAVRLFTQIAQQYTEDGFFVKAIAIYKKIIKLDPTRLQVYEHLAGLYHRQGLVNEARTQYQVLGDYYLKHSDAAAAINIFVKMGELEPDNPSHHLRLAELYQQRQLWDKALRSYRTIAELMLRHDRVEEAVRVYQRAIEVHSEDLGFITDALTGLKEGGHTAAALKLLALAVAANPHAERVGRLAGLRLHAGEELDAPVAPAMPEPAALEATTPEPAAPATPVAPPEPIAGPEAIAPPAEPPRPGPPPPQRRRRGDDELFALGIDDDQPSSMVSPPPDFDRPGSAFDAGAWPSPASGDPSPDSFRFEVPELDVPDLEESVDLGDELVTPLPWQDEPAAPAPPAAGAEEELDLELELDLSELDLEDVAAAPAPPAAAGPPAAEVREERAEIEFELDLDEPYSESFAEPAPPPAAEAPPRPAAAPGPAPEPGTPPHVVAPPPVSAPPAPPEPPRLQDLLAEAEVFAKYGLEEKALERLDQVLAGEPQNLDALQLLLDLQLKRGDGGRGQATAERIRRVAAARRLDDAWQKAQARLARAGLQPTGGTTAPRSPTDERLSRLVESLGGGPAAAPRPATKRRSSVDDALADIAAGVREKPRSAAPPSPAPAPPAPPSAAAAPPPAPSTRPAPPPPQPPPRWAAPEAELEDELPGIVLPEERPAGAAPALDDTGMDWLREEPKGVPSGAPDKLFDDEEDFFDLAAELEEELGVEEGRAVGDAHPPQEEPTLEQIVEGFKKGVAENLSPEDYDTHYNLGIAYREMGLLDEAIGEFQLAAKDPAHLVDCCSMLGVSFLEKGLPELAVKWYQRGLTATDLKEEVMLSLLYDMGEVYMMMGDEAGARKTFVELYGINSHYRDVVAKIEELGR